jgi:hypothetical protein
MQVNINYVRGADDPKSGTVLGGRFSDHPDRPIQWVEVEKKPELTEYVTSIAETLAP